MKKLLIGCYNRSVIMTYLGVTLSLFGIFNFIYGDNIKIAIICFIGATICDLFDGVVARKCKRNEEEKKFGIQIDSLADMVSFAAFPFVILISVTKYSISSFIVGILYVLAAITRLAWFNITNDGNKRYFQGLPVAYSGLIIPVYYVFILYFDVPYVDMITQIIFAGLALLFVLNFKIKKPKGVWYIIYSLLAIFTVVAIIFS